MARIHTVERLRELITDYGPRGAAKIQGHICEQGKLFLARSPFLMLATRGDYGLGESFDKMAAESDSKLY